jgi:putative ATP-dependent endonuclease of OLD family
MVARWWVGRRLEPLTAGIVIAVEGPSDRIIVNRIADVLGIDLDKHDIVVVETDGCGNMRVVESIFGRGGFDIPLFELVDDDNREDIAERIGADSSDLADLAAHHVFVSLKDLEDEYVRAIGAKELWGKIKAMKTFSRASIKQCRRGPDGFPTEADLAAFIRERTSRKIPSALVAASLIDAENAPKVQSVTRLLAALSFE